MKLKCWQVYSDKDDYSVLVFHYSRNKARFLALESFWYEEECYIDLLAERCKEGDQYSSGKPELLDGETYRSKEIMWKLGWRQVEYSFEECSQCKRYEWEDIFESKLEYVGDNLYCFNCRTQLCMSAYALGIQGE